MRNRSLGIETVGGDLLRERGGETPATPLPEDVFRMQGRRLPAWQIADWANSPPLELAGLRGQVVFVRFWTDLSPSCERTMPAVQKLADEFAGERVKFIGVYYPPGVDTLEQWQLAQSYARDWGVRFPLAYDRGGRTLISWWLSNFQHMPAQASFILGPDGRVLYVHPGPEFYPTDDPLRQLCNDDFETIRSVIRNALPQSTAQR